MDTFDLRWPKTTATFCTNGWRCRIVWRGQKGGMGGTIENNEQCKRRVADSLQGAPELLDELRAAGFTDLADEIQTLAPLPSPPQAQRQVRRESAGETLDETLGGKEKRTENRPQKLTQKRTPKPTPPPLAPGKLIDGWANALGGSSDWEACNNRRAKSWLEVASVEITEKAETWREDVLLKPPAAKGKQEWVLKCVWQTAPKGHARATPRYYAAESFHGICACVASLGEYRTVAFFDAFMSGVGALVKDYPEVAEAVDGWAGQKALLEKPSSVH